MHRWTAGAVFCCAAWFALALAGCDRLRGRVDEDLDSSLDETPAMTADQLRDPHRSGNRLHGPAPSGI